MTHDEKYFFDLYGYLVVPNALSLEQVAELNAILDTQLAQHPEPNSHTFRFGKLLSWGAPYRRLIANPRITDYLDTLLGNPYRLDHDYLDVIRAGLGPIGATLHGGGATDDRTAWYRYHDGRQRNGLFVVAYNLKDVHDGNGGFGCIPASHKANLALPPGWENLEKPVPAVRAVTGPAGSAILFTEALTHGTLPWRGSDERRTIFMKYSPHPLAWAVPRYDHTQHDDLTEEERRLLEGPNARYRNRPGAVQ
jgi:ectoine hydroxylase-related dioxygenase (phytanoyl-CoA dioxygenase family)